MWILTKLNMDPMSIIYDPKHNTVDSVPGLYIEEGVFIVKVVGLLICMISVAVISIRLMIVSKPEEVSEGKKDMLHKLFILFCIGSAVFFFNLLKDFFDAFFF